MVKSQKLLQIRKLDVKMHNTEKNHITKALKMTPKKVKQFYAKNAKKIKKFQVLEPNDGVSSRNNRKFVKFD